MFHNCLPCGCYTFIDYNIPPEDIVYGVTEGGVNDPAALPNIDNPDLYLMAARAQDPPITTTMFGGQSLWNDGNGDKYDFFIFGNSNPGLVLLPVFGDPT